MTDLHPAIAALAPLLGSWTGRGHGDYPTIDAFEYDEDVTFGHSGKPFLVYSQRTRSPDGTPMHTESGYLRVPSAGRVELILAQPTGITEIDEGTLDADGTTVAVTVESTTVGLSSSAKEVVAVSRSLRVAGDKLTYTLSMAAVGQPMLHHLSATLHRVQ